MAKSRAAVCAFVFALVCVSCSPAAPAFLTAPSVAAVTRTPCCRGGALSAGRRPLQLRAASTATSQVAAFSALAAWLKEGGGRIHRAVEFVEDDRGAGRGLRVADSIAEGELLVSVPRTKCLSCEAEPHGADRTLLELTAPNIRGMQLGLMVLQGKLGNGSQASSFGPYFEMLPSSYDSLPVYFAQDIPELQFSHVEQQAVARVKEILRVTQICQSCTGSDHPVDGIDIEQVLWAHATASSRALRLEGMHEALVPMIDLINHSFDANCRLGDEGARGVGVRAVRNLNAGESLRLNYGDLPNDDLVLDYGFVVEENPHDFVRLPAGALSYALQESVASFQRVLALEETEDFLSEDEARALSAAQLRLLHASGLSNVTNIIIMRDGEVEAKSMALVRVLVLRSPSEAAGVTSALEITDDAIEERARDVIRRLCTLALKQLPTSTSHDMRLVHGDGGPAGTSLAMKGTPAGSNGDAGKGRGVAGNGEAGEGEGKMPADAEWEGKTRSELGSAISAVEFRLAHKHILNRAVRLHT